MKFAIDGWYNEISLVRWALPAGARGAACKAGRGARACVRAHEAVRTMRWCAHEAVRTIHRGGTCTDTRECARARTHTHTHTHTLACRRAHAEPFTVTSSGAWGRPPARAAKSTNHTNQCQTTGALRRTIFPTNLYSATPQLLTHSTTSTARRGAPRWATSRRWSGSRQRRSAAEWPPARMA